MAPVISIPENIQELWDAWSVRGSIIISSSVQALLLLLAPLRKRIRNWGKWVVWFPYLFADWVALYTIGLIVQSNSSTTDGPSSDIMAFWAPFLLLHLGGPDSITSYSLEDNKLWQRHLLELVLQFCLTIYVILKSFSRYELLFATLLVLFAGVVKYVERNVALYRASLDRFGEKWQVPTGSTADDLQIPIPVQFQGVQNNLLQTAVLLLGSLKRIIIGPAPKKEEQEKITRLFHLDKSRSRDALRIIEIELSLLYEALHTKLPVIASTAGFIFRMANFSCIFVALLSFSLVKKHYQLELVDILLTYGLLIGALALDFLSIILLIKFSDWFAIARPQDQDELPNAFSNRRRWCKEVSQLNFFTYYVKDYPIWLKNLDEYCMGSLLENININFRCPSYQNFRDPLWQFIWSEVLEKYELRVPINKGSTTQEASLSPEELETLLSPEELESWLSPKEFEYLLQRGIKGNPRLVIEGNLGELINEFILKFENFSQTLLVWHVGTELCFQRNNDQCCRHESGGNDYRSICKLLSDYMFYLAVGVQPSMMATALDDWKAEFKGICEQTRSIVPWSFFSNEKTACKDILEYGDPKIEEISPLLYQAVKLARRLEGQGDYEHGYPWELMSKVWVHLMFFAAVTCSPYVHLQQPSQGGELLTFVWLLLNHLGLGIKYKTLKELLKNPYIPPPPVTRSLPVAEQPEDGGGPWPTPVY